MQADPSRAQADEDEEAKPGRSGIGDKGGKRRKSDDDEGTDDDAEGRVQDLEARVKELEDQLQSATEQLADSRPLGTPLVDLRYTTEASGEQFVHVEVQGGQETKFCSKHDASMSIITVQVHRLVQYDAADHANCVYATRPEHAQIKPVSEMTIKINGRLNDGRRFANSYNPKTGIHTLTYALATVDICYGHMQ